MKQYGKVLKRRVRSTPQALVELRVPSREKPVETRGVEGARHDSRHTQYSSPLQGACEQPHAKFTRNSTILVVSRGSIVKVDYSIFPNFLGNFEPS